MERLFQSNYFTISCYSSNSLTSLLHEELPFNCVVCSKGKQSSGVREALLEDWRSWKSRHQTCNHIPVHLKLPLSSSEQRFLWLEKSNIGKIPIFRISGPSECLWVGTFRACKTHIRTDENFRYFSQKSVYSKYKWNYKCILCCQHALRQESSAYMEILDACFRCVPVSNVSLNLFCQHLELLPL